MGNDPSKQNGKAAQTPREPPKAEPVFMEYAEHGIVGRRPTMEDAHLLLAPWDNNTAIFGVFDGHFGTRCSIYVAEKLPEVLKTHPKFNDDVHLALKESFLQVDKAFLKQASADKLGDGSTGIITLLKNEKIYCANTGDSRGVMCEGGKTVALSEDHKPNVPKELARIEQAGGIILLDRVQGKLAVARAFGDLDFKNEETLEAKWITAEPDILEVPLTKETEFILLACDGLWDKFSNEDAVEFVRTRVQTQVPTLQIVEEIVKEAYNLGSTDNITAILVVFNHSIASKTMRRAGAAHTAEDHVPHATHEGSVHATPNKSAGKKDKTPKKDPKGVTKTSAEPPQVIPAKKSKTADTKGADKHVHEPEHKTPRTDESSQSKTSDEKKTELASPKSDKSVSRESDKSPRKTKEDKLDKAAHKKHKKDESKSQSSPSITVNKDKDDTVLHSSSADSLNKDKS